MLQKFKEVSELFEPFLNLNGRRPKWAESFHWVFWFVFNLFFGLFAQQIEMAIRVIKPASELIQLQIPKKQTGKCSLECKEYPEYRDLSEENRKTVKDYAKVKEESDELALRLVQIVSSVQLVLYLARLLFNLHDALPK